jgi:hypothetical protein
MARFVLFLLEDGKYRLDGEAPSREPYHCQGALDEGMQ